MNTPVIAFEDGFGGELLAPDHPDFDRARRVHNGMVDKLPNLIARCHDVSDVIAAVRHGRSAGLEIAVRGGGEGTMSLEKRPPTAVC